MYIDVDTGETHECGPSCDQIVEMGGRFVCRLTKVVLGVASAMRPVTSARKASTTGGKTKSNKLVDEVKQSRERNSRRRVADAVVHKLFSGKLSLGKMEDCSMRACNMYDWLGEKLPFEAVAFATMVCISQGVNTDVLVVVKDEDIERILPPMRSCGSVGIKQNAVTRAYTAIMRKSTGIKTVI